VAPARTFGFLDEVEAMRRAGLARGGSLANTVVLDAEGVVNEDGLRFPDEFVRHKVLDLIGDLSLLGRPLLGHVSVERGGHALHQELVRALVSASDASEPG
jgi:UDP-3-O-[3-hydroxymyristoyl] N-acetylglucosamine deacetylase